MKKTSIRSLGAFLHLRLVRYMSATGMMAYAIAPELDSTAIEKLPEAQRGWYAEKDGKFVLDLGKVDIEDTSGLKNALAKERQAAKDAKEAAKLAVAEAMKAYEGIDPVKTRALLAKFNDEEEAALIASGKVDEVIAKRMSKREADFQKQLEAARGEAEGAKKVASTFQSRVLDNHVRAAAAKAGIHPFAVEDALLRARSMFSLDDKGEAVQMGSDGSPVLGKDGKTPFTPTEWLESMKETAPHWFPTTGSGGGAGGSGGAGAGGKTIRREAFDAMSPAERAKVVKTHVIVD